MKKLLIIAFAICVLSLSACSSLTGTDSSTSNAAAPIAAVNTQSSCQVLQDRQSSLDRAYQLASVKYRKASVEKNAQEAAQAKKELTSLHQSIVQTQNQLKAC
jgi:hypothetical protein